jgi:hypothetical protein
METLTLVGSKYEPEINFNNETNCLLFKGVSYSADPLNYFNKIMKWLELYKEQKPSDIVLDIQVYYLNTTSTKLFIHMIKFISTICDDVKINWIYDEDDDDIYELGRDIECSINVKINYTSLV